mgnify:CR=1 FL=1
MKKFITICFIIIASFSLTYSQLNTVVSLTGSIKNELTKEPVGIDVRVFNGEGKQIFVVKSNSKDGYYFMTGLKPDTTYYIRFNDFSYFANSYEFTVPKTNKYQEYSKDFTVTPKKEGMKFPLKVSPFDVGKSNLRAGSDIILNEIVSILKLNRRTEFLIKAYPDNSNDSEFNSKLTTERAEELKEYFISKGVRPEQLNIEGSSNLDTEMPPPVGKQAKGKKYRGPIYLQITKI